MTLTSVSDLNKVALSLSCQDGCQFDFERRYYLAGPMSGYPEYNYPEFEAACKLLRRNKIEIKSPHEIVYPESRVLGDLPYSEYIDGGMKLLAQCNGLILLPGWAQSTGSMLELSEAATWGLPVYFLHIPRKFDVVLVCMNRKPPA